MASRKPTLTNRVLLGIVSGLASVEAGGAEGDHADDYDECMAALQWARRMLAYRVAKALAASTRTGEQS